MKSEHFLNHRILLKRENDKQATWKFIMEEHSEKQQKTKHPWKHGGGGHQEFKIIKII